MEAFIKVYIKSEDDLPDNDGNYFCCRSGILTVQNLSSKHFNKSYMREIRRYLKPVEIPEITDEDVITAALNYRDKSDDENTNEDTMQIEVHWYDKQEAFASGAKWYREEQRKRMNYKPIKT